LKLLRLGTLDQKKLSEETFTEALVPYIVSQ
jgi:hypothetical protein